MALHLVGETIDKTRSHYRAETGKFIQLMRGIYVDADDDIETTVLRHAVRIAKYVYPQPTCPRQAPSCSGQPRTDASF